MQNLILRISLRRRTASQKRKVWTSVKTKLTLGAEQQTSWVGGDFT